MTPKLRQQLIIGGSAIAVIAVVIILTSLFSRNRNLDSHYKELMAAKQENIEFLQNYRVALQQMHGETLEYARESDRRDSMLMIQVIANQKNYQSINKSYAQVSDRINRISSDVEAILSAYREY